MSSTQKSTQIRTHVAARDVLQANAGLHVLRRVITETIPSDFDGTFMLCADCLVVSWTKMGENGVLLHDGEIRGQTLLEVLEQLRNVDWGSERINARVFGDGRAFL